MSLSRRGIALIPLLLLLLARNTIQQEFFEDVVSLERTAPDFETELIAPAEEYDIPDTRNNIDGEETGQPFDEATQTQYDTATEKGDTDEVPVDMDEPAPESEPQRVNDDDDTENSDAEEHEDTLPVEATTDNESSGSDTTLDAEKESKAKGNVKDKQKQSLKHAPEDEMKSRIQALVTKVRNSLKSHQSDKSTASGVHGNSFKAENRNKGEHKHQLDLVSDNASDESGDGSAEKDLDLQEQKEHSDDNETKVDEEKHAAKVASKASKVSLFANDKAKGDDDDEDDDDDNDMEDKESNDNSVHNGELTVIVESGKAQENKQKNKQEKMKDRESKGKSHSKNRDDKSSKHRPKEGASKTSLKKRAKSSQDSHKKSSKARDKKKKDSHMASKNKSHKSVKKSADSDMLESPDDMPADDIPQPEDPGRKRDVVSERDKRQTLPEDKIAAARAKLQNAAMASDALTKMESEMGYDLSTAEEKTQNLTSQLRGEIKKFKDLIAKQNDDAKSDQFKKLENIAEDDVKEAHDVLKLFAGLEVAKLVAQERAQENLQLALRDQINTPQPLPAAPFPGDMGAPMSPYQEQATGFVPGHSPYYGMPFFNPSTLLPPPSPPSFMQQPEEPEQTPQNTQFSDAMQPPVQQSAPVAPPPLPFTAPPPVPFVNPSVSQFQSSNIAQEAPMFHYVRPYQTAPMGFQNNMFSYPGQEMVNTVNAVPPPQLQAQPLMPAYRPSAPVKVPEPANTRPTLKPKILKPHAKPINDKPKLQVPFKQEPPAGHPSFIPAEQFQKMQPSIPYNPSYMQSQPYNAAYMQNVLSTSSSHPFSDAFGRPSAPQNAQSYFLNAAQRPLSPWRAQPAEEKIPYIYKAPPVKANQKQPPPDLKKMMKAMAALHSTPTLLQQRLNGYHPAQQRQEKPAVSVRPALALSQQYNEPPTATEQPSGPQSGPQSYNAPNEQASTTPQRSNSAAFQQPSYPVMQHPSRPGGLLPLQPPIPASMQYANQLPVVQQPSPEPQPFAPVNPQPFAPVNPQALPSTFMSPSVNTPQAAQQPANSQEDEDEQDMMDNNFNDQPLFQEQAAPMSPPLSNQFALPQPPMQVANSWGFPGMAPQQGHGNPNLYAAQQYAGFQMPQQQYQMAQPVIDQALTRFHNTEKAAEAVKKIEDTIGLSPPVVNHIIDDVETDIKKERDEAEKNAKEEEAEIDKEKQLMHDQLANDTKPIEQKIEEDKKKLDEDRKRDEIAKTKLDEIRKIGHILAIIETAKFSALSRAKLHLEDLKKRPYPDIKKRDLHDIERQIHERHRRNEINIFLKGSNNSITASRIRGEGRKQKGKIPYGVTSGYGENSVKYEAANNFAKQMVTSSLPSNPSSTLSKRNRIEKKPKFGILLLKKLLERVDNLYAMQSKILKELVRERQRGYRRKRSLLGHNHRHHHHHRHHKKMK